MMRGPLPNMTSSAGCITLLKGSAGFGGMWMMTCPMNVANAKAPKPAQMTRRLLA